MTTHDALLVELDYESDKVLRCPFNISDEILQEPEIITSYRLYIYNRVLSNALRSVGLRLEFTHLTRSQRKNVFTEEACTKVFAYIYDSKKDGVLNSFIAMNILVSNMLGKLDCDIYFCGRKLE